MQVTFSTLLKGAKVLKSAGTVSDKFNSLGSGCLTDANNCHARSTAALLPQSVARAWSATAPVFQPR